MKTLSIVFTVWFHAFFTVNAHQLIRSVCIFHLTLKQW